MLFDYEKSEPIENYKLMSQTIIPRPIAWIVTEHNGVVNVAPFSYFTGLSSKPPTMVVSIGHKSDGSPKDTLKNLRETKRCTLCMVTPKHLEMMHFSSKEMDAAQSEAETFDIPLTTVVEGYPPMVEGAPAAFFCDYYQEVALDGSKTVPVILQIRYQVVDDACIVDKEHLTIDCETLARVGKSYALLGEVLDAPKIP
ncbi:flavin reductase family protein [Hydrogenimonas sp. SS33]|uniref:flavin reductase family protein n=1 Tax=Hydrogenimonas leucolamina TaxID=2954236 RepID=UPI00336BEEBC